MALSGAAPGDRVLDVGCGPGYLTRRVAHAVGPAGAVVGIDPSEPMIRYARRVAPAHCRFHVAGAEAVPEPDGSFDVVVTSFAVHHIPPDGHPAAFREMYRVLRPGGGGSWSPTSDPAADMGRSASAVTTSRPTPSTGSPHW